MDHALYKLHKIKIVFENHCLIIAKLLEQTLNHPKFHAIIHFVKCLQDKGSAINYNMAHSEVVNKYIFKVFYERANKKKYELQILKHNIRYSNIIAMQNIIIIVKVLV